MTPTTLAADAAQALQGVMRFEYRYEKSNDEWVLAIAPDGKWIAFSDAAAALTALSAENTDLKAQVAELTRERGHWMNEARRILKDGQDALDRAEAAEAKLARLDSMLSTIVSRCDTAKQQCAEGAPVSAFNLASAILGQIGGYRATLQPSEKPE